jgi:hypothetical protein
MAVEICVCCSHADLGPPAIAHCPDRPCLSRWGCGSGDAAYGVHGVSLYGCGANRNRRLLREYGDKRPSSAHETGAVQGHFARLRQRVRLRFLARPARSVDRTRVSHSLWARGILAAGHFASRAVDQTRSLPPYSQPHSRLISRSIRTPLDRVPAHPARL